MRVRRAPLRVAALFGATLTAGAGVVAFAPTAAEAVSQIQTGYWSALPAAPQVPSGGFEVGSNPSGEQAVAAIRFELGPGESVQQLNLKVNYAQPASQVAIELCLVAAKSASWQPPSGGGPGALSAAPTPDCSSGVAGGTLSADGTTMTFDLSPMSLSGSTVDVLLQPSQSAGTVNSLPGAPSQSYPAFDSAFNPVTTAQIYVATNPSQSSSSTGSSVSQPVAQPAPATAPSSAGGGAAPPVALPPASTDTGQATGPAPVVAPTQQPSNITNAAPVALVQKGRDWRLLFFVSMLSSDLLFLLLWYQHRQPAADERPKLSIYDPPPAARAPSTDAAHAT